MAASSSRRLRRNFFGPTGAVKSIFMGASIASRAGIAQPGADASGWGESSLPIRYGFFAGSAGGIAIEA
jgi:hypothetical protein